MNFFYANMAILAFLGLFLGIKWAFLGRMNPLEHERFRTKVSGKGPGGATPARCRLLMGSARDPVLQVLKYIAAKSIFLFSLAHVDSRRVHFWVMWFSLVGQ